MLNKSKVIEKLLPHALKVQKKFKLLPSVCISQAILETGWLRHYLGNNIFGIKWTRGCGYDSNAIDTYEWIDGVRTPQVCIFRKYGDISESFYDYGNLLTSLKRYAPVVSAVNYKDACYQLYECGYCTDPEYPKKLISLIEDNKLYKYDTKYSSEDGILGPKTRSSIKLFCEICSLDHEYTGEEDILKLTRIILNYNMYLSELTEKISTTSLSKPSNSLPNLHC